MKPIVVVDRDAFFEEDRLGTYYTEAERLEKERYAQGRAGEMDKEGYLVTVVKPGARVAVLWPPVPDVGTNFGTTRIPILIADTDSGVDREKLEAEGFLVQLVKPGSRVVIL